MASRNLIRAASSVVFRAQCPHHLSRQTAVAVVNDNVVSLLLMQQQRDVSTTTTKTAWEIHHEQQLNNTTNRRLQVSWFSDKTTTPPPPPTGEEKSDEETTTDATNNGTTTEGVPSPDEQTTTETIADATESSGEEQGSNVVDPLERISELEEQLKDLNDRLLRSLAEQDNTRRIAKRDVDDARQYAIKSFAKGMLDVADNLERALKAVPGAMASDKEAHPVLATLYEGIEMTERGLIKTFEGNGLTKFGTDGEPFDPNIHNALFEYPDPTKQPGTIGQIIKPGFMLNKRVLRPAEVGVIKKE
jgi:molecular chaperone GrpE